MSVTVRATLPKGDTNGLAGLEQAMADDPDTPIVVVGIIRPDTIEMRPHDDDNPRLVKTVLVHIEALNGAEATKTDKLLRKVYEQRTGKKELPFEGEQIDPVVVADGDS